MDNNQPNRLGRQNQQKKSQSNKVLLLVLPLIVLLIIVFAAIAGGTWLANSSDKNKQSSPTALTRLEGENDGNNTITVSEENISNVAKEVSPSVVSIVTNVRNGRVVGQGAGTGIIISKDGYIITNKHVVRGSSSVSVMTSAGDIFENVELIGADPLNDIAFLKIKNASNLKPAEIGESSSLRKGQSVVAIGNSLGEYDGTVTSGIISGLGRPVAAQNEGGNEVESLTDLVQTDAAINPGNSGGPLVNMKGQVVGINTAIVSGANGIGFAIPINATKGIMKTVLEKGEIERAYLGVRYVEITPILAKSKNLPRKKGALVSGDGSRAVDPGSPADEIGLQDGDIITKVGTFKVGENGNVSSLISEYQPGDVVEITYLRDGKEVTAKATLDNYEARANVAS